MARATAPSRRPPSAVAAAAAPSPPARVPQQRRPGLAAAVTRGALSHPPKKGTPAPPAPVPRQHAPPRRAAARAPTCACSPTTHPGSFRCALHRGQAAASASAAPPPMPLPQPVSSRLSAARRASMANPLVRIAAVEGGDQIRRALASLVRPSPSQHRRRADAFRPRRSRLSVMSSAARDDSPSPSPSP